MHRLSKTFGLLLSLLLAVCLFGHIAQAKYGAGSVAASAETSTYVFAPDQSTVVQTGGIASVHWTYSIKGEFQLTVDPNAGVASFAHVDANATDDSPFKRTLDLNHVFNMTSLAGTVEPTGSIKFTGKATDDSDILITATLQDDVAHLIGQTTPPPNSADFFIFSLDAVAQLRKYGGGSGTADDPYQIASADDLVALGETPEDYDKHFILTDDIDLDPNRPGGKVFDRAIIAPDSNDSEDWFQGTPFTGVFDGNGHVIRNAVMNTMNMRAHYIGLFGLLHGEIRNLGAEDVSVFGWDYVGGLVGESDGIIINCHSTGSVNGDWSVGGLVGLNNGDIVRCYSSGQVSGNENVGGLAGFTGWGFAWCGPALFHIQSCYSRCQVTGGVCAGGLAGDVSGCVADVIECYSTGPVSGSKYIGGLAGSCTTCLNSFWDIQTSGQATSIWGATGKTTAEMQKAKTFLDAGWDFVNIWDIGENQTYPYLRKYSAADINQDASVNLLDLAALAENWLTGVAP